MTIKELSNVIQNILPFAYSHFKSPQSLPFMVYIPTENIPVYADNCNYIGKKNIDLEYYFKDKDFAKEKEIEDLLIQNKIPFVKSGDIWIKEEDMYEIIYSIQI